MERVMIIGCGGSGKSTLSRVLAEKTGLPLVHLDQIFWSPGNWQHLEKEEFDKRLLQEMENQQWILDGNYNRTMKLRLERADTVIYLDYNRWVCIFRWIKRVVTNWGKSREDMAPGCAEWYHALLAEQTEKTVYIFKTPGQLKQFLKTFPDGA